MRKCKSAILVRLRPGVSRLIRQVNISSREITVTPGSHDLIIMTLSWVVSAS